LVTPHISSFGITQYGDGASVQISSRRSMVARTRVPATFEITICTGAGNLRSCAASPGISSSSAWP
jgi:hypothetical protein